MMRIPFRKRDLDVLQNRVERETTKDISSCQGKNANVFLCAGYASRYRAWTGQLACRRLENHGRKSVTHSNSLCLINHSLSGCISGMLLA